MEALERDHLVARGEHARRLLADEVLGEALRTAERDVVADWKASTAPVERESLHGQMIALERLHAVLRRFVADADMVKATGGLTNTG